MSISYQRAQQQAPRISEMSAADAHKEWKENQETYRPDLPMDELVYRCYIQDMLYIRSLSFADEIHNEDN